LEMKGKMVDPMSGKEMDMRQTIKFTDDKNQTIEMYNTPAGGKEFKSMEIKMTKKEMDRQTMPSTTPGVKPMPPGQNQPMKPEGTRPADKK